MVKGSLKIQNPSGLHARPSGVFVQLAQQFQAKITFCYKGKVYNAKSILDALSACVTCGSEIELVCDGPDEQEAFDSLAKAIEAGLSEELEGVGR
jgi:phosphocarrier protein HPr